MVFCPSILAVFSSLSMFCVCFALELPRPWCPCLSFILFSLPRVLLFCCGLLWFCLGCGFIVTSVVAVVWTVALCTAVSDQKSFKNYSKMPPKGLQNRCWRAHGSHLGAFVDERLIQDVIFDNFGSLLGALWDHFGGLFWNICLVSFWGGLWDLFLIDLGPQNASKKRPKRESKQKPENHRFCCYLLHLSHSQGSKKWSMLMLFGDPFLGVIFGPDFDDFCSLLGSHFGDICRCFLGTFLWPFLEHRKKTKRDPKREGAFF